MFLKDASDEELKAELHRREEEKKRLFKEEKRKYAQHMNVGLTREMVNLLAPFHDRTSCSDDNIINGLKYDGCPRCVRCGLLDSLNGWDENLKLDVYFCQY